MQPHEDERDVVVGVTRQQPLQQRVAQVLERQVGELGEGLQEQRGAVVEVLAAALDEPFV